jgi:hypothetical protein
LKSHPTYTLVLKREFYDSCIFFLTKKHNFLNITMVSRAFPLSNKLSIVFKRLGRKIDQIFQEI